VQSLFPLGFVMLCEANKEIIDQQTGTGQTDYLV